MWILRLVAFLSVFTLCLLFRGAARADSTGRFFGNPSCASSSCHGGGAGKDQCAVWLKKDFHSRAHAILGTARALRIADELSIPDPGKDLRCTVCHSPLAGLPAVRFAKGAKPDTGVSCESCHGPAEQWLRFHTRQDVTHEQRVAAGLREMRDLSGRANVCVACHLNIDPALVRAGHPEMFFELDGNMRAQPPHWREEPDAWLGPRAWLVGQATALRELSWKLGSRSDADLALRWKALHWLLLQSPAGSRLPAKTASYSSVQGASERLARSASRERWSREASTTLLRKLAQTSPEFREGRVSDAELRRRAEVLTLAVDRLWQALKANGAASSNLDTALSAAASEARAQEGFEPQRYAAALEQVEVALELLEK